MMTIYEFEISLVEQVPSPIEIDATDEMANRLFEAGCDDQLMSTCEGVVNLSFHRESESLGTAIDSAMQDIRKAGYTPSKVMVDAMPQVA